MYMLVMYTFYLPLFVCILLAEGHIMIRYGRSAGPIGPSPLEYVKKPTTLNISEIFIGRCNEYVQCVQQDQCSPSTLIGTCDGLWSTFMNAFAFKDPCQASDDDYDDVIEAAMPYTNEDETLFWSGVPRLALDNGRVTQRYTILEESFTGYLANELTWCGQTSGVGIDYVNSCPSRCADGGNETMYTFWKAASRAFARQAKGVVAVALNGSRTDAFRNTSTFATNELPNLNPETVSHVRILLVYDISLPDNRRATCGEGSILDLETRLDNRGFKYTCVEEPSDFKFLQCAADPENIRCQLSCSSATGLSAGVVLTLIAQLVLQVATRSQD